jgi:HEAT repeat protein
MKKRLLIGSGVVLAVLGLTVWLEPTAVVRGWLGGEAFYQDRPTRYWSVALTDADPKRQFEAHQALKDGGPAALPVLMELLQNGANAEVRWKAADLLRQRGPEAAEAAPALVRALHDDDPHVRAVAAAALAAVGHAGPEAIPVLRYLLSTDDRLQAVKTLAQYGPEAAPAISKLIDLLHDSDSEVRWNAARTLGKIGPAAQSSAPALIAALKDDDALVREHAAESLGQLGPGTKEAVPALVAVLHDPDARVRRDAVRSLGQRGEEARSASQAIRELLNDKDAKVRKAARTSLEQVNPHNEDKSE